MAEQRPRKPSGKSSKRPAGKSSSARSSKGSSKNRKKKTVRASVESGLKRSGLLSTQRDEEAMLTEFSDDTNEFFVDEQRERKNRSRVEAQEKKERRKAEKRKPLSPLQRRVIRILSYAAIITVVLIVGIVLSLTVLFKTQVYEVTGVTKYSETEIAEACGISEGQNIFLAPKRPAEKRIKNKYPYVEEAHVTFKIPDTIKIGIVEAVEGYMVKNSDTEYLVISTKGRILDRVNNKDAFDLPIFIGPKPVTGEIGEYVSYEDDTVVTMIDSITQTFADNGYQGITEIDATNMADISFTYEDRVKVKLGIPEDLDYKIRTAMTIINENLDKNDTTESHGVLDVSRCNTTRRSYFSEGDINPTQAPTQDPSQPSTENTTGDAYSGGDEEIDLGYDYYDEDGYGHYW